MFHLSTPAEVGIWLVLFVGLLWFSRRNKENLAVCIVIMTALTFLFVGQGEWVGAGIYALLTLAWIYVATRKRRRLAAKAEKQRREDESVANSAGEPDNLPY